MSSFGAPIITTVVGPLRKVQEDGYIYYTMTVSNERVTFVGHPVTGREKYAQTQRRKTIGASIASVSADTLGAWAGLVQWGALYCRIPIPAMLSVTDAESRAFYEPEERRVWERK